MGEFGLEIGMKGQKETNESKKDRELWVETESFECMISFPCLKGDFVRNILSQSLHSS